MDTENTNTMNNGENTSEGKYVKATMRKAIKKIAYISQIAKSISLLPTPQDFTVQVISETNLIMGKIMNFSNRINSMLEDYSNFPADWFDGIGDMFDVVSQKADLVAEDVNNFLDDVDEMTDAIDFLATGSVGQLLDEVTETDTATNYAKPITDQIDKGVENTREKVDNITGSIKEFTNTPKEKLNSISKKIKGAITKIQERLSTDFSDYIKFETPDSAVKALEEGTGSVAGSGVEELAHTTVEATSSMLKNFDIGKVTTGLIGVAAEMGALAIGLESLPSLNMERVLDFGKSYIKNNESDPTKQKMYEISEKYKEIVENMESPKKEMRAEIMGLRKASADVKRKMIEELSKEEKKEKMSVAKEVRRMKLQAKAAKTAQKFKEIVTEEVKRFKTDIEDFGRSIGDEWMAMQSQYEEAVIEIKDFFTGDPEEKGGGSKYIDECCDAIETDCDAIKETCKNLSVTIASAVSQIPAPTSFGQCFDNVLYKVLKWFESMKVIFNEIKRVVNYGIDIVRQVAKIVKIIINGVKNLADIKAKIMEILGIKWILDFIDSIVEMFSKKCKEGKEVLENTLSPIFYSETDEYERRMDALEEKIENPGPGETEESIENYMEKLEEQGETEIYAYKSPLLNEDGTDYKGWVFYYSNIDSQYSSKLKKNFSRMLIKKAAKTGHRKRGGVNMLKRKRVFKTNGYMWSTDENGEKIQTNRPKAYDAFYWYTKWTTEPTDDALDKELEVDEEGNFLPGDHEDVVSPVMTTENGTLVELEDGRRVFVNDFGIKAGDTIIVEGKKFRVRQ